jgi:hypothetical protein
MPVSGDDCLCRDCLRKAAAEQIASHPAATSQPAQPSFFGSDARMASVAWHRAG